MLTQFTAARPVGAPTVALTVTQGAFIQAAADFLTPEHEAAKEIILTQSQRLDVPEQAEQLF